MTDQKKLSIYLYRVRLKFVGFFCRLNKASNKRKRLKLSEDYKKVLRLHNEMYNKVFKFIGCYFKKA